MSQGDFDGDDMVLWPAEDTPHIAMVVAERQLEKAPTALVKRRSETPLSQSNQIVARVIASSSLVGTTANLITRARAAGASDSLIFRLGDQLQAAIDSVKWETQVDTDFLAAVSKGLPRLAWLDARYKSTVFAKEAQTVNGSDTISRLWNEVARWFKPAPTDALAWEAFVSLVPEESNPALKNMVAMMSQRLYRGPVAAGMRVRNARQRAAAVGQACKQFREWAEGCTVSYRGQVYNGLVEGMREPVFRILWHLSHKQRNAAVFVAFMDQVIRLAQQTEVTPSENKLIVQAKGVVMSPEMSERLTAPIAHKFKEDPWTV